MLTIIEEDYFGSIDDELHKKTETRTQVLCGFTDANSADTARFLPQPISADIVYAGHHSRYTSDHQR